MKDLAFLEYNFLFSPGDTSFTSIYQFEDQLAEFFRGKGLDALVMKTVDGQMGKRIILLTKTEEPSITPEKQVLPVGRPASVGSKMRNLAPKDTMGSAEKKFRKRK